MEISKTPTPEHTNVRATKGGSGQSPPKPHTTTAPRPSSGGKGQMPPKAKGRDRSTPGGKGQMPPSAEVPSHNFVDPIPTRPTPKNVPTKAS